ncbi:cysteine hydrolase [Citreicella sp. C3M06]|uniref:cysteine hydrolase family protein n=1 Tax=Citreicella sp. C3M06 TaxID=2841564 RepID=UPI001C08A81D|nr:isochorismatase family protein [Citreicella sp. C3M06]MBU2961306.1 cysteine hydrolase [Citreicella sp. C3M06]
MNDWLLVIDMQPGFGAAESPWCTPGYERCAERIGQMLPLFEDRVLFTRFVPPESPTGAWRAYYAQWEFAVAPGSDWLWQVDGRWQGYRSIASHRFAKWREAEQVLPADASLTLCGVATDCCVLGTAVEAVDAGRNLRLVEDACAAGTEALHRAAVAVMADRAPMCRVVSTAQVLAGA